jgi:outer membrane lipoprotein-sorting protein
MFRKLSALFVPACLTLVLAPWTSAQGTPSVDEIVARNLQAKGGLEKLRAVQSIKQTSHLSVQGMDATLTIYGKRPNLLRQEISIAGQLIINAFDGTTAWLVNPLAGSSDPIVVTGPEAEAVKEQSDFESPLVDYKARGYTVEFVGSEMTNGKTVNHLKVMRNQQVQHAYLDATTGLEVRVVSETPAGQLEQELSDYRDVDGIKIPFSIRNLSNGNLVGQITVDTVELNVKVDDAFFKLPKKAGTTRQSGLPSLSWSFSR